MLALRVVDGDDKTLAAHLMTTVGPLKETIQAAPRETIRPAAETAGSRGRRAVQELSRVSGSEAEAGIDLGETLGEGGMGVVRLGTQRSMGRKVAVKTARVEKRGEEATLKLLREAWVTGALEHPNVLPVYDVGIDAAGAPVIVMRLVDGTEWAKLMHDSDGVRDRFGAEELLEWNLRILMQVCNAVRFAHSRGILHRDLKPENIMVGKFGEVYVLDWGIAVSLEDDGSGRLPLAADAEQMVGTPAYMAPEMLGGESGTLSVKTDVYLLGSILFEIVEGEPPHRCDSIEQFVDSVVGSNPNFRTEVPEELEGICRKAMACDPDDRYEDAEELRLAVQGFLRHRGSAHLAREATERLAALRTLLADPGEDPDAHRLAAHNLFAECRFGFQEALAQWSDNQAAREGRREAVLAMVSFELDQGDHRAASVLLAEIDGPPAELVERIEAARAESAQEREEFERLREFGREHDKRVGQRTRWFGLLMLGFIWTTLPIYLSTREVPPDHLGVVAFPVVFLAIMAALGIWARDSMTKTAFNRRAGTSIAFAMAAQIVLALGAMVGEVPVETVLAHEFFLWFVIAVMLTIFLERRIWPTALGYMTAFFAIMWAKSHSGDDYYRHGMLIMSVAHAVLTLNVLVVWRPKTIRRAAGETHSG